MAISATFNDDLYRVQLELTGLSVDAVRIERSTNGLFWETVRGGTALPVVDGAAALDDYEYAVNATTFYRVLDVEDLEGSPVESDDITPSHGDCEVVLKSIRYPLLNHAVRISDYSELDRPGRVGVFDVSGRSFPVATTDVSASLRFTLSLSTETAVEARKLHLALALGDVLFLQVPPDGNPRLPPRSVYFVAESTSIARVGVKERRLSTSPLIEVAPPGPAVVGTTLTWQTVWDQYAGFTQLWGSNQDWRELLETVGSGEDLVTL